MEAVRQQSEKRFAVRHLVVGLATTGVDAAAWLTSGAVGVVLLAAGALLVARRRQGVRE